MDVRNSVAPIPGLNRRIQDLPIDYWCDSVPSEVDKERIDYRNYALAAGISDADRNGISAFAMTNVFHGMRMPRLLIVGVTGMVPLLLCAGLSRSERS
jgi:hypothetical protein